MASQEERTDRVLQRVFAVTLRPELADGSVVYLKGLASEMAEEAGDSGAPLYLTQDTAERALMARLNETHAKAQAPVPYLLSCYSRASEEYRSASMYKDKEFAATMQKVLAYCKQLCVSYASLTLTMDMFPQPRAAQARGALQLLDAMDSSSSGSSQGVGLASSPSPASGAGTDAPPLPPGFLEDLAERAEAEGEDSMLGEKIVGPIVKELSTRVMTVSIMGEWARPMSHLARLVSIKPIAKALVSLPEWLPRAALSNGRALQAGSLLGPFFGVTALPDAVSLPLPNVRQECFSDADTRRPGDIQHAFSSIRMTSKSLYEQLHGLMRALLANKDTREAALGWLAAAIEANNGRAKMQVNPLYTCSEGFAVNLSAVLLKLCEPFMEPDSGKAWGKVDASYVTDPGTRVSFDPDRDTKLAATKAEEDEWVEARSRQHSGMGAGPSGAPPPNGTTTHAGTPGNGSSAAGGAGGGAGGYHFICECFFMTAKGLHLGAVKTMQQATEEARSYQRMEERLPSMEAAIENYRGRPQFAMVQAQVQRFKMQLKLTKENQYCYMAVMQDEYLLRLVLGYYRLLSAWMLRLASPPTASGGGGGPPLPSTPPMEFRTLPEYLVEDLCEALQWAGQSAPQLFGERSCAANMLFLTTFIGEAAYVKNPFLRFKLAEVLHQFLPQDEDKQRDSRGRWRRPSAASQQLAAMFEGDPNVASHLVPSLLRLYVDVEGGAGHFYEKLRMRYTIAELLEHLWKSPAHHAAWAKVAGEAGGRGPYLQFCNMLINDSIFLLDEAIQKLPEIREIEVLKEDEAAWAALPEQEQQEKEEKLADLTGTVRWAFSYAASYIRTLQYSTAEFTRSFLLEEMVERIAGMLNYFLKYLTGPERRKLKVSDPSRYNWDPKRLLASISTVYLHLTRDDARGAFAEAVARDSRSYREDMFTECAQVLRQFGLLPEGDVLALEALGGRVKTAALHAVADDELLADAPDAFLDPITYTMMKDPVMVPSGSVFERASITRHLLSDPRDPITRSPLTVDDLKPAVELKQRMEEWLKEKRSSQMQE